MTGTQEIDFITKKIGIAEKSLQEAKAEASCLVAENLEPLMTVPEVAEYFRIARNHVYCMVRDGKLKYIKVGTVIRFKRSYIETYGVNQ